MEHDVQKFDDISRAKRPPHLHQRLQKGQLPRHRGRDELVPVSAVPDPDQVCQGLRGASPQDVPQPRDRAIREGLHAAGGLADHRCREAAEGDGREAAEPSGGEGEAEILSRDGGAGDEGGQVEQVQVSVRHLRVGFRRLAADAVAHCRPTLHGIRQVRAAVRQLRGRLEEVSLRALQLGVQALSAEYLCAHEGMYFEHRT